MIYKLPELQYKYDYLEPYFDKLTMKIHYTIHHQNYINNINTLIENYTELKQLSIEDLIANLYKIPEIHRTSIKNNAGGHLNHTMFWKILKHNTYLSGKLKQIIEYNFGNINTFQQSFEKIALNHFGSGWVWLIYINNKLNIISTNNQDNPLMGKSIVGINGYPLFGLDLWEHAYYLKYQHNKIDYIKSFWKILNWDEVYKRFKKIK